MTYCCVKTSYIFYLLRGFQGVGNFANFESGHTTFDIKFVATKFHGTHGNGLIVIHLIASSLVKDNSNLMCQLLANALGHYSNTFSSEVPGSSASAPRLPPKFFLQVDGVSTNWGNITFAFICYLVKIGAVGSFCMSRNPVGTHLIF